MEFEILLLLLNKKKENKEKYTCNPSISITPANSSNIIQVDPSTGDLSEINTNSILNAVNSIIDCYINKNTIFNNIKVNTNATIASATITGSETITGSATITGGTYTNLIQSPSNTNCINFTDSINQVYTSSSSIQVTIVSGTTNFLNPAINIDPYNTNTPYIESLTDGNLILSISNIVPKLLYTDYASTRNKSFNGRPNVETDLHGILINYFSVGQVNRALMQLFFILIQKFQVMVPQQPGWVIILVSRALMEWDILKISQVAFNITVFQV